MNKQLQLASVKQSEVFEYDQDQDSKPLQTHSERSNYHKSSVPHSRRRSSRVSSLSKDALSDLSKLKSQRDSESQRDESLDRRLDTPYDLNTDNHEDS